MSRKDTVEARDGDYSLEIRGWYRVVRGIILFLLHLLCRVEVEGLEHIPDEGPYLYISNHLHWLDPPVLMAIFPHRAYVFAAEKWEKNPVLGPLFKSLDSIFVRRGEVDRKALRKAMAVLEGGGILGMAPEGTRSSTGAMQRGHSGAAYLAYRAGVQLLPAVATGQEKVFPSLLRLRRATVRVAYGPPFAPPLADEAGGRVRAADMHAFTEEMMYRLAALLPPEYRGVYEDVAEKRPDLVARYAASK